MPGPPPPEVIVTVEIGTGGQVPGLPPVVIVTVDGEPPPPGDVTVRVVVVAEPEQPGFTGVLPPPPEPPPYAQVVVPSPRACKGLATAKMLGCLSVRASRRATGTQRYIPPSRASKQSRLHKVHIHDEGRLFQS